MQAHEVCKPLPNLRKSRIAWENFCSRKALV